MDKRIKYSRIEAIEFTLSASDIFELLFFKGDIPAGFRLDCDNPESTDWPIKLHVKRVSDSANGDGNG